MNPLKALRMCALLQNGIVTPKMKVYVDNPLTKIIAVNKDDAFCCSIEWTKHSPPNATRSQDLERQLRALTPEEMVRLHRMRPLAIMSTSFTVSRGSPFSAGARVELDRWLMSVSSIATFAGRIVSPDGRRKTESPVIVRSNEHVITIQTDLLFERDLLQDHIKWSRKGATLEEFRRVLSAEKRKEVAPAAEWRDVSI